MKEGDNCMKNNKAKNFDADSLPESADMTSTVSANEATGMMFNPPVDDYQLESIRDMHQLQSTEFAAAQFGEIESDYGYLGDSGEMNDAAVESLSKAWSFDEGDEDADSERREDTFYSWGTDGAPFNPELVMEDPDINSINSHDDRHASMRPLTAWDRSNGEGLK